MLCTAQFLVGIGAYMPRRGFLEKLKAMIRRGDQWWHLRLLLIVVLALLITLAIYGTHIINANGEKPKLDYKLMDLPRPSSKAMNVSATFRFNAPLDGFGRPPNTSDRPGEPPPAASWTDRLHGVKCEQQLITSITRGPNGDVMLLETWAATSNIGEATQYFSGWEMHRVGARAASKRLGLRVTPIKHVSNNLPGGKGLAPLPTVPNDLGGNGLARPGTVAGKRENAAKSSLDSPSASTAGFVTNYNDSSEVWEPPVIHLVWVDCAPFDSTMLMTLDSLFLHMPLVRADIHVILPLECATSTKAEHFSQLLPIWRTPEGAGLHYVHHVDIASFLVNTPLENDALIIAQLVIEKTQRRIISDLVRLVTIYQNGGIFLSGDVLVLRDLSKLRNSIVCENRAFADHGDLDKCDVCNTIFSFDADHLMTREMLLEASRRLKSTKDLSDFKGQPSGYFGAILFRDILKQRNQLGFVATYASASQPNPFHSANTFRIPTAISHTRQAGLPSERH
eukprot:GHVT01033149.1.p1 GENE.GHVT01033149.1~~GHVT01033149.1.p1  ORF type:complete len:508 (+),score=23.64 GHVT01033149.1:693-2216(+)